MENISRWQISKATMESLDVLFQNYSTVKNFSIDSLMKEIYLVVNEKYKFENQYMSKLVTFLLDCGLIGFLRTKKNW